jgi:hypothetical protein
MAPDGGLERCACPRGEALRQANNRDLLARQAKARKAADKAAKDKLARQARAATQRRHDREQASKYRDMPLIDGGYM